MNIKIDRFVLAIIVVIILAWIFPFWGSKNSPFPIDRISSIGISMIFFFYGLKLSPERMKAGLLNWKLHLLVQATTFLIFPVIVLIFYPLIKGENSYFLWLAFLFLGALPSTVSSSVVMVSIAKGNVPGAIFNASISGLIGISLTPLWMGVFLQKGESGFNLGSVYLKLVTEILLPVIIGLILHKFLGRLAIKYSRQLSTFDKSVILLIIYQSFAVSFDEKVFTSVNLPTLIFIFISSMILFHLVYFITGYLSKRFGFSAEDAITARFCGTKKSLVHGTVFSKILFPQAFPVGIILLPLMVFHAYQIFVISIFASRLSKRDSNKL